MPLSTCIEQEKKDDTEEEWRDYFLSARIPDHTCDRCTWTPLCKMLSPLSRLMAEFYEIVDRLNMEDVVQVEPKKVVGYLVESPHPPVFKAAVEDQLGRQVYKQTKPTFRGELEGFMRFEAHIVNQQSQSKSVPKVTQHQITTAAPKPSTGGNNSRGQKPTRTNLKLDAHRGGPDGVIDPIMLLRSV
ncbi:hypothetical protein PHMEG_00029561 [Phytophthora megakarya]|uniref:Uncharacterized protein n=1 Tax=Phytophthora megakarya TaxID=4795 RepID=A0A225V2C2_9STRA|nr:hypothetical protein PHMEG_00029561 [Phytophthora megakarya]